MWKDLSLREKAELIKLYVSNGITNRRDIIADYDSNTFDGPSGDTTDGTNWMQRATEYLANNSGLREMPEYTDRSGYPIVRQQDKPSLFRRMSDAAIMNDPYTGAVAQASGWNMDSRTGTATQGDPNEPGAAALASSLAGKNVGLGNVVKSMKNFVRMAINKEARLAESYSSKVYTFDEAYKDARSNGQKTFFWNGDYYNTDYEGEHGRQYKRDVASGKAAAFRDAYPGYTNPELRKEKQEELDTYGITNEQTQNKNFLHKRALNNLDFYGDYDWKQAVDALVLNHAQRTEPDTSPNNLTHYQQLRFYLGYPLLKQNAAKARSGFRGYGAPVRISEFRPTTGTDSTPYYYTFLRNPYGNEGLMSGSVGDKYDELIRASEDYLADGFYKDARNYGLDYAVNMTDKNTKRWSDYFDKHWRELVKLEKLANFIPATYRGRFETKDWGNATGLGNFTQYGTPEYRSFYDLWDIGLGNGNNTLTFGLGRPFEYYDRRYHNDETKQNIPNPDIDNLYSTFDYSAGGLVNRFDGGINSFGLGSWLMSAISPTYDTPTFGEAFRQARINGNKYFKWNGNRYNTDMPENPFVKAANEWNTNGDLAKEDFVMQIKREPDKVFEYYDKTYSPKNGYRTINSKIKKYDIDTMYSLGTKGLKDLVIPRGAKYDIGDTIWNELNNYNLSYEQKLGILANSFHETAGWTELKQYGNGPANGIFMFEPAENKKYNKWLEDNGLVDSHTNQTKYVANLFINKDAGLKTPWDRAGDKQKEIRGYKDAEEANSKGYRSAYNHMDYTTKSAYKDWESKDLDKTVAAFEGLFERAGIPALERRQRIAALLSKKYTKKKK